jgi:hypothetical protein
VKKATGDMANVSRERAPSFLMVLEHAASRKGLWSEQAEAEMATHWEEKKRSNMETQPFPSGHTTVPWNK